MNELHDIDTNQYNDQQTNTITQSDINTQLDRLNNTLYTNQLFHSASQYIRCNGTLHDTTNIIQCIELLLNNQYSLQQNIVTLNDTITQCNEKQQRDAQRYETKCNELITCEQKAWEIELKRRSIELLNQNNEKKYKLSINELESKLNKVQSREKQYIADRRKYEMELITMKDKYSKLLSAGHNNSHNNKLKSGDVYEIKLLTGKVNTVLNSKAAGKSDSISKSQYDITLSVLHDIQYKYNQITTENQSLKQLVYKLESELTNTFNNKYHPSNDVNSNSNNTWDTHLQLSDADKLLLSEFTPNMIYSDYTANQHTINDNIQYRIELLKSKLHDTNNTTNTEQSYEYLYTQLKHKLQLQTELLTEQDQLIQKQLYGHPYSNNMNDSTSDDKENTDNNIGYKSPDSTQTKSIPTSSSTFTPLITLQQSQSQYVSQIQLLQNQLLSIKQYITNQISLHNSIHNPHELLQLAEPQLIASTDKHTHIKQALFSPDSTQLLKSIIPDVYDEY